MKNHTIHIVKRKDLKILMSKRTILDFYIKIENSKKKDIYL